ncbi:MAG: hypothetical protein CMQ83_04370 [Gammaproteobacteria bacterium]|nr:hypothetical protein [Gammaproteobacteria bacterium]
MKELINTIFNLGVKIMWDLTKITGLTYQEINAIIFLIIQPALIILFFILWKYEKKKNTNL